MASIFRTVSWTLLTGAGQALDEVQTAVGKTDFTVTSMDQRSIDIDVPRAIVKNRWAAKIHGEVSSTFDDTEILWTVEGLGNKHFEHLVTIAEQLPEGILFDHGIQKIAATMYNRMFGRKETRHLANLLDRGELVHAMGIGQFANKAGMVAITDKRIIFLEKSMLGSEDFIEFALNSVGALSIGKRMGGETLTLMHSGTSAVISALGHGQADAIAQAFRQLKEQPPATAAPLPQDPMVQLERLGDLHAKGILTNEEFQTQKALILSRL